MDNWSWTFEAPDGTALRDPSLPQVTFTSQADAESWIGEAWRSLLEQGVERVYLMEDGETSYGPMSLRPLE